MHLQQLGRLCVIPLSLLNCIENQLFFLVLDGFVVVPGITRDWLSLEQNFRVYTLARKGPGQAELRYAGPGR